MSQPKHWKIHVLLAMGFFAFGVWGLVAADHFINVLGGVCFIIVGLFNGDSALKMRRRHLADKFKPISERGE